MALTPQQEDTLEAAVNAVRPDDYQSVVDVVALLVEFDGGVNDLMRVHLLEMHTDPTETLRVEALLETVPGMPGDGPVE